MKFELYEVWAEDSLGQEELVDTTSSIAEAKKLAQEAIDSGADYVTIYRETDSGELEVIEEIIVD